MALRKLAIPLPQHFLDIIIICLIQPDLYVHMYLSQREGSKHWSSGYAGHKEV